MAQYNWPVITIGAPVGGALESTQQNVLTQVTAINTKTPTVGQKTMAASSPVVIASDQSALPVTGTFFQTTQPVSGTVTVTQATGTNLHTVVDSSALPTGAATETTLAAMSAKLPTTIGQKASAASFAVVLASDQPAVPTAAPVSLVSTANSSTVALGISAVFTGTSEAVQNYAAIEVSVFSDQGSAALGLSVQQSSNGTNWDLTDTYTVPAATGKTFSFAPAASFFRIVYTNGAVAQTVFRLQTVYHYSATKASTHSLADTITLQNDAELVVAQLRATNGTNSVPLIADAQSGLQVAPAFAGVVAATGNGVAGTGTQRVAIASDNTPFATKAGGKTCVARARLDYTTTNVTTAAYVQLIASIGATAATEVEIFDSSGQTLFLAVGAAASEVDQVYIFPGGNGRIPLSIIATGRVSLKAVSALASVGECTVNFYA